MCIFASLCKNCERNLFLAENSFFYFSAPGKGNFFVGIFIFVVRGYFPKGARNFFSAKVIFFIPGKLQFRMGQLEKLSLIISSRTTCRKFRKIGSLGDSYGRGGGSPPEGGGWGDGGAGGDGGVEKNAFPISSKKILLGT